MKFYCYFKDRKGFTYETTYEGDYPQKYWSFFELPTLNITEQSEPVDEIKVEKVIFEIFEIKSTPNVEVHYRQV